MAGVLDALASYVTSMLADMAREEVAMLIGVSGQIDDLSVKLRDFKNFLADAERRNITDESVRGWVEELKRAMYLATDILDLCHLKAMERGSSKDMGCLNPLLFCMRNPLHAHDIGTRIKGLNQQLDDICERGRSFNFIRLESYQDRKTNHHPPVDRKTHPVLDVSGVIGEKIEEDTRALIQLLTKEAGDRSDSIMVFPIVGVGGIGKTTLSKKIFNDEAMQTKFSKKIWLSITQEFSEVELLRTAITAVDGKPPESQDKALLVPALVSAIKGNKFFLVLDDMWGVDEWNKLLMTPFSHGAVGSRVLLTTRHDVVARGMRAMEPYHHVDKLGSIDAWSLLKKQVLRTERSEPEIDMLKDIGLQILAKCDGLPLAVNVMGGLLCQKKKERRDWENVLNDTIWLEEFGTEYYKELIARNLIEPDTSYIIGDYVCNMHDVVRAFAQFVARNEALVVHGGETFNSKLSLQRFIRLSIETKGMEPDEFAWRCLQKQKSLRMLMMTGCVKIKAADSLIAFPSLRVLHIESGIFAPLVGSLDQLKHLRYLTISKCNDINSLPENIHKMKFLQHVSFKGCKNLVKLPDSIVKLGELRYLDIEDTQVNSMPRGFCALTNLRSLWGFQTHLNGDRCSLEELRPLSLLSSIGLVGLKNVSVASFATKVRLGEKAYLSRMQLCGYNSRYEDDVLVNDRVSERDQRIIEEMFGELYPPPSIEDILINGYFGRQLPRWLMMTATTPLCSLRLLVLEGLACCTQLPDGLSQLPCFELLEVDQAPMIKHVGPEFVQPYNHRGHPSSQALATFPRLHKMFLTRMEKWEEEVQAMPVLEDLYIRRCRLRRIPPGLATHARALKKLTIWRVQRLQSIENFASVVELDLYDLPDLTRISNFPKLRKLGIDRCQKLESLQEMDALQRLVLPVHYSESRLPSYLQTVKPGHLLLDCRMMILLSMALGESSSEWDKFSHIQHVKAYANVNGIVKSWHLFYTRDPYNIETNIDLQEWSDDVNFLQSEGEDGLPRLAALMESSDEDEEDVDNPDEIEEERMGQGRKEE